MALVNRDRVASDWTARGFSCDIWIDPPGREWIDFVHDTDELVMLLEGEEEFEMNGKKYRLSPGEELLIPAGTCHTARNVGAVTSRWLYGYKRDAG
jgi:uncharacterized cupin superfamily protein